MKKGFVICIAKALICITCHAQTPDAKADKYLEILLAETGEVFYYNATNYLLVQKVIEKYHRMPYDAWLRQVQFPAAGMKSTFFANSDQVINNKAPSYSYYYRDPLTGARSERNHLRQIHEVFPVMMHADAGAFSTARDLSSWISALKSGRLLNKSQSIASLWKPVRLNNGRTEGFGDAFTGYALGWPTMQRSAYPAVTAIGGGRCAVMVYPKDDLSIILLTNLSGCAPQEMADVIAGYYLGR